MKILILIVMLSLSIVFFSGCPNGVIDTSIVNPPLSVEIDNTTWTYKNIGSAWQNWFWGSDTQTTCFTEFTLWYQGEAIQPGDLVSYTAESNGLVFQVPVDEDIYFDSSISSDRHGLDSFYAFHAGTNTNSLPLGVWTFTLDFVDETETVHTITFPKPGTTEIVDNTYIITEDGVADSTHFPMVKRAVNITASYDTTNDSLTVLFGTDDTQARSGWISLYDENTNYIGGSDIFVDENGVISSNLNTGSVFYTDGTQNTYTTSLVANPDIDANLALTHYVVIKIIDGKQYESFNPGMYDCISYSAPAQISTF